MNKYIKLALFSFINILPMPSKISRINFVLKFTKNRLAKSIFCSVGENVNIRPGVKLRGAQNISLGTNSSIGDKSKIIASENVFIGENTLMAPEVIILTESHNIPENGLIINSGTSKKPVFIGSDVWIGTRVIILPGAKINNGVVVAAGAVVIDKEYPAYSIIGGVPAKVIKFRR